MPDVSLENRALGELRAAPPVQHYCSEMTARPMPEWALVVPTLQGFVESDRENKTPRH